MAGWGWAIDTATHVPRMMAGGVFERFPRLKIVIGHMGELIPFHLKRINLALTRGARLFADQARASGLPALATMQRTVLDYMHSNVFITTSGVFEHSALLCSLMEIGIDNILFSVDDPFADNHEAMAFLDTVPLSCADREKLAHGNAERLLRLPS